MEQPIDILYHLPHFYIVILLSTTGPPSCESRPAVGPNSRATPSLASAAPTVQQRLSRWRGPEPVVRGRELLCSFLDPLFQRVGQLAKPPFGLLTLGEFVRLRAIGRLGSAVLSTTRLSNSRLRSRSSSCAPAYCERNRRFSNAWRTASPKRAIRSFRI